MDIKRQSSIVLVGVLAVAMIFYALYQMNTSLTDKQATDNQSKVQSQPAKAPKVLTLTEQVNYEVRKHNESITVTLTMTDGIITSVKDIHSKTNPKSAEYQDEFESSISNLVIGKSISEVKLDAVSGASYTTAAFMQAIGKMKG
ncbi:MAG: FMN-binding protein [Candidatus Roizmanbacteria bacterium]